MFRLELGGIPHVARRLIFSESKEMLLLRHLALVLLIVLPFCIARAADTDPITANLPTIPVGLNPLVIPADNPITKEKVELGKMLFFDPRLSKDGTVSCASCHDPKRGWSNGADVATGIGGLKGGRSAPTIINAGYQHFQFWDGRALHLEGQALGPIQNPIEMNMNIEELVKKLNGIKGYREMFQKAFKTDATADAIAKAIASFERTILSGNAPYDRFKAGDKKALSESAQRGMKVFFNKGHCSACHVPPNFTDGAFHNLGVGIKAEKADFGRFSETKLVGDRGGFKTPTLREINRTNPYMHDGSLKTLEDVIDYYDKGGTPNEQLDEEIFALNLTAQEKTDLATFLKEGLSSPECPEMECPELPK
jgi:cytochrome c peroxidase